MSLDGFSKLCLYYSSLPAVLSTLTICISISMLSVVPRSSLESMHKLLS